MQLKDFASLLPGYVTLYVHSENQGWRVVAGAVESHKELSTVEVEKAIPLEAYSMEVVVRRVYPIRRSQ